MYPNPNCSAVQQKQKCVWEEKNTCKRDCMFGGGFCCLFGIFFLINKNPHKPCCWCQYLLAGSLWPEPSLSLPVLSLCVILSQFLRCWCHGLPLLAPRLLKAPPELGSYHLKIIITSMHPCIEPCHSTFQRRAMPSVNPSQLCQLNLQHNCDSLSQNMTLGTLYCRASSAALILKNI